MHGRSVWNEKFEPDEPHVHFPTNALTIAENELPEHRGTACGICGLNMPMTESEWRVFMTWWIFGRNLPNEETK